MMKIYIVDTTRKLKKIKRELEREFHIETKENTNFKMTKNDYVIFSNEVGTMEGLEKLKNIFFLTENKEYRFVWQIITQYKVIDVIDNQSDETYIANRIAMKLRRIA